MPYFDINLNLGDDEKAIREAAHKFAKEVMRPIAKKLDLMTADEVVAQDSPLWDFIRQAYELGYHKAILPEHVGGLGFSPLQYHIMNEELAWGSFGLTVLLGVFLFPYYCAVMTNDEDLIEKFTLPYTECTDGSVRGCWAITEPDHGSDTISLGEEYFSSPKMRGNIQARPDGDEYVIHGQKSSWVSGGTIATHALLHVQIDPSQGFAGNGVCLVPLDPPGVSRGRPLRKMGQRDLNQGEIFFDEVRIPKHYMFVDPEFYTPMLDMILASANMGMAVNSTGLARATFEEAFTYAKERVQGGRPLIEHYSIKQRIFGMFSRVETCRALSRAVLELNMNVSPPVIEYSLAAKTRCTQMAFENAHDAIQILGGNGLTEEYLTEKLFRDARATLIEDGNNEVLAANGGQILAESYPRPPLDL